MYNNIPTKVLTGEVRLSYVSLVAPRANTNDPSATPKYSVTLLIPKSDVAVKQNIDASIEAAALDAQGKIWNGVRPLLCLFLFTTETAFVTTALHSGLNAKAAG